MLMTWASHESCNRPSEGLRFLQRMKDNVFHNEIKRNDITVGLSLFPLSEEVIANVHNEGSLEKMFNEFSTGMKSSEGTLDDLDDNWNSRITI